MCRRTVLLLLALSGLALSAWCFFNPYDFATGPVPLGRDPNPAWGLLLLIWVSGCLALRSGRTWGAAILLASSAALVFGCQLEAWQQQTFIRTGLPFDDPRTAAGALGLVAALVYMHPLWRRDTPATFVLLATSVVGGVLSAFIYLSTPTMLPCGSTSSVESVVEISRWQRLWWWWNGLKFDETRGKRTTTWMSDHCTVVDFRPGLGPHGVKRVWRTKKVDIHGSWWGADRWSIHSVKIKEQRYHQGHEHGPWTEWHENGRLRKRGQFRMGSPEGQWTWWHDNGVKLEQGRFVRGKREGALTCWRPDGRVFVTGRYCAGKPCGRWGLRDRKGRSTGGFPPDEPRWPDSSLCDSLNDGTIYDMP